ncbi:helix-turn-helix transcriptional regulator [Actinomycetospora termitidis]|uniref:Helix-turn-helix transcriptional regulator n=1 Tax=Actinomycetospora termitidis TaxID=3053470 RepID=A0ABT7MHU3_9PSEU|nr:helix-turn-helix transcriptional regulator [Actinomycetospora sp. Odt1-22]MDL5159507.1 helix-turn-helix transcriptional regulator [Actinomycetospora sp. Odt1-22]
MTVVDDALAPAPWRPGFATTDPDHAAQVIRDSYQISRGVRMPARPEDFHFAQQMQDGDGFALGRFRCPSPIGYRGPQGGVYCIDQVYRGRVGFLTSRHDLRAVAGEVFLVPNDEPWEAATDDVDVAGMMLDRERVAAYAASVSGSEDLTFTGLDPVSPGAAHFWDATVAHVRDTVLDDAVARESPLVQGEAFRMLAAALLTTFPNTARAAEGGRVPRVEPAVVRRAAQFMDEHAHDAIGLEDVAAAARVSPRALQMAFRRHRDQTPLEYLRRVRMARAHQDLRDGDPTRGDTVAEIAARWGFGNAGRFSGEYRRVHGCSPNETLRR